MDTDAVIFFKKKYGIKTPGLMIAKLLAIIPDFTPETSQQGHELCKEIGVMIADLEFAMSM